jgi:hypothetical protein
MGMLAIWGMIASKPTKMLPSSTTGFTNQVIMGGTTNPTRKIIQTTTQIIIRINLPSRTWF